MIGKLTCALAMFALPATAQDLDETGCKAFWNTVTPMAADIDMLVPVARAITARDGWCEATDITFETPFSRGVETSIEAIRWRGDDLATAAAAGTFPTSLEIEVENIRNIPQTTDPVLDYVFRVQNLRAGIDGQLATTWDAQTQSFQLKTLDFRFPSGDGLQLTGRAEKVDLADPGGPTAIAASAELHEVGINLRNEHGNLFEFLILSPMANLLLTRETSPDQQVAALKTQALAVIDALPEDAFPPDTRFALAELIEDMPNPNGSFTLDIAFDPGFGMEAARKTADILTSTGIPAIWRDAVVTARYDRKPIPR